MEGDPFLRQYDDSELRIASEFLTTWLPFLSRDLCRNCVQNLSRRISSLSSHVDVGKEDSKSGENSSTVTPSNGKKVVDDCDAHSLGSWKDEEAESNSLGSLKDEMNNQSESPVAADASSSELISDSRHTEFKTPKVRMSWADMAQEDELEADGDNEDNKHDTNGEPLDAESSVPSRIKVELSREQREFLRLKNVRRKKDFICLQRVNGKITNILQGLELHTGVFSAVEQKRIVDHVYELAEMGRKGELKERTFTAPRKWMKGKGRVTIQFGCCYNYATDKKGNPPGILRRDEVDPLPSMFKVIIKRLIRWSVLPPSCVPDSCIVNIYDEGDCIPPHIDNHDFVRPFCTISFLSECKILFGTDLKIDGPGEFSGDFDVPLPVGSVLVLNGNGADVAKHCVPAVPSKRISITFRRMDETKRPVYYAPEPDLQDLKPLSIEDDSPHTSSSAPPAVMKQTTSPQASRHGTSGGFRSDRRRPVEPRTTSPQASRHELSGGFRLDRQRPEEHRTTSPQASRHESSGGFRSDRRRPEEPRTTSPQASRHESSGGFRSDRRRPEEPRYSARGRGPSTGPRTRINWG